MWYSGKDDVYVIIDEPFDDLEYTVCECMEEGYTPVGGPVYNPMSATWMQAMYKAPKRAR